tara:strand:+ start:663 stop:1187 length:525 start_codon:yes stop_codon:yes gene_type:complete
MPLLHLKLIPLKEGGNECEVNLPHEIRSQVFKYKKSLISVIPDENVASDADGDGENLDLFPQGCVMCDLPFFTGYEITSNVGGGGLLPIVVGGRGSWLGSTALTQRRADFESEYHINLKSEEIPSVFRCKVLKADGLTAQPMTLKTVGGQSDAESGFVRQIDLFFEYETNNLFF